MLRAKAANDTFEELKTIFWLRIGLVLWTIENPMKKNRVMNQFKQHELDLLVATTVIEVGVDVPNASLMVIENAEQLGTFTTSSAQRSGWSKQKSHCVDVSVAIGRCCTPKTGHYAKHQ